MENYSFLADLLQTFRMMSDSVKVLLIYMPGCIGICIYAIYLHHLRYVLKRETYTILPSTTPTRGRITETLRTLDRHVARVQEVRERAEQHSPMDK